MKSEEYITFICTACSDIEVVPRRTARGKKVMECPNCGCKMVKR